MTNFASDNITGVHPRILEAIAAASTGVAGSYGGDPWTQRVEKRLAEIFEHDVAVAMVTTGTAANSIAIAMGTPPWGIAYCHATSHVNEDECGAPEMYSAGAKLKGLTGDHGKIAPATLATALPRDPAQRVVHFSQPASLSIANATEAGAIYRPDEVGALGEICKRYKLWFHMDGARFANALVATNASPAQLTWKAGVDVLSFGATKNGALACEAVVVFDKSKAWELQLRRKRAGQLWSKSRFIACQMEAYLADDLWLASARQANRMARRLAEGLMKIPGARLEHPVEANEIFIWLPDPVLRALEAEGIALYRWHDPTTTMVRLVAAFDTTEAQVDRLVAKAQGHARQAAE